MTDQTDTPRPVDPGTPSDAAPAPTVATTERPRPSWLRPVVVAACLVGTLLVGGVGGFALGSVVARPHGPLAAHILPGQGDRPDGWQGPGHSPGIQNGERPRPERGPAHEDGSDGEPNDGETDAG
jgi:hypothetical protein